MQKTKAITAYLFRVSPMLILILFILVLSGCSTKYLNPYKDMSTMEIAWQAGHVMDVAQTYSLAGDSCYEEDNYYTKMLIGANPSKGEVIAWGLGTSYVHAVADKWLEHSDLPKPVKLVTRVISTGLKFNTVNGNYEIGIRIFGTNHPKNCTRR